MPRACPRTIWATGAAAPVAPAPLSALSIDRNSTMHAVVPISGTVLFRYTRWYIFGHNTRKFSITLTRQRRKKKHQVNQENFQNEKINHLCWLCFAVYGCAVCGMLDFVFKAACFSLFSTFRFKTCSHFKL